MVDLPERHSTWMSSRPSYKTVLGQTQKHYLVFNVHHKLDVKRVTVGYNAEAFTILRKYLVQTIYANLPD